jgi:hypothetical protein
MATISLARNVSTAFFCKCVLCYGVTSRFLVNVHQCGTPTASTVGILGGCNHIYVDVALLLITMSH